MKILLRLTFSESHTQIQYFLTVFPILNTIAFMTEKIEHF